MLSRKRLVSALAAGLAVLAFVLPAVRGNEPKPNARSGKPIPPEQFDKLHKMIRVQPGEQRFWQIPWKLSITEAREQAAREGKPIFVWSGAGGAPLGVC